MKYARLAVSIPIMAIGAMLLAMGIPAVLAAHYISPEMKLFDGWINRMIDGSKDEAEYITPSDGPLASPRLAA